jgi:hypothetical protein
MVSLHSVTGPCHNKFLEYAATDNERTMRAAAQEKNAIVR